MPTPHRCDAGREFGFQRVSGEGFLITFHGYRFQRRRGKTFFRMKPQAAKVIHGRGAPGRLVTEFDYRAIEMDRASVTTASRATSWDAAGTRSTSCSSNAAATRRAAARSNGRSLS